jgi:eukaryotic-like serine/threonine-protein kinase
MSSSHWDEIQRLYEEALALPPAAQADFLLAVRSQSPLLSDELASLLSAGQARNCFLDQPPAHLAEDCFDHSHQTPSAIGPFKILRLIGEGGMGAVYLASQEKPQRQVALKVVRAGHSSPSLLRRFEQEANLMGILQHPGIAQVYEAGTAQTPLGAVPYFAMEFIEGQNIDEWAARNPLDIAARLELLAKVCDAVQHAHQRGVIHRDLKPGNILVHPSGQPKVLDFGIARLIEGETQLTRQTSLGQILGTLDYMSPEQALGNTLEVDLRSDVYSLGVILYLLLANRLPFRSSGKSLTQALQQIQQHEPERLGLLNPAYRGDIETIAAKALEKNKEKRYAMAGELAADIRRYLAHEPILARPASTTYQLAKFTRRHRALVIGALLVVLSLAAGTVVSTWQALRALQAERIAQSQRDRAIAAERTAQSQRDRAIAAERTATAEKEAARKERDRAIAAEALAQSAKQLADSESASAKAINSFLTRDLLEQADVNAQATQTRPDPNLTVRTALDRAASRIDGNFNQQPDVEANIRLTLGFTYKNLGLFAEAQKHAERAYQLRLRSLGANHADTLRATRLLGVIALDATRYSQAEQYLNTALQGLRRLPGAEKLSLATMTDLANVYEKLSRFDLAEKVGLECLQKQRQLLGPDHNDTLTTSNNLSNVYARQGKFQQALDLDKQILQTRIRLLGEEHPQTLVSMNNVAIGYQDLGLLAEAAQLLQQNAALRARVFGPEHTRTLAALNNLSGAYADLGRYEQAEAVAQRNLEIRQRTQGPEHAATLESMLRLAQIYRDHRKWALAEPLFQQVIPLYEKLLGPKTVETMGAHYSYAELLFLQAKFPQSEATFRQVSKGFGDRLGPEHQKTLRTEISVLLAAHAQGHFASSTPLARRLVEVQRRKFPDSWQRFLSEILLANNLLAQNPAAPQKDPEAQPLLSNACRALEAQKAKIAHREQALITQLCSPAPPPKKIF